MRHRPLDIAAAGAPLTLRSQQRMRTRAHRGRIVQQRRKIVVKGESGSVVGIALAAGPVAQLSRIRAWRKQGKGLIEIQQLLHAPAGLPGA